MPSAVKPSPTSSLYSPTPTHHLPRICQSVRDLLSRSLCQPTFRTCERGIYRKSKGLSCWIRLPFLGRMQQGGSERRRSWMTRRRSSRRWRLHGMRQLPEREGHRLVVARTTGTVIGHSLEDRKLLNGNGVLSTNRRLSNNSHHSRTATINVGPLLVTRRAIRSQ